MPDQNLADLIETVRARIVDPGSFVLREQDTDDDGSILYETVPTWAARAVAAGLEDGALGYVPATRSAHLMTELLQTAIDRYKAELADARDAAYRQQQRIDAERAQWQAEIANLVNLIAPYDDEAIISIGLIRKALREGPAPVPGSSRRAQEGEVTRRQWALAIRAGGEALALLGPRATVWAGSSAVLNAAVPLLAGEALTVDEAAAGDVAKCPQCGKQTRSYRRGCSWCGFGRPASEPVGERPCVCGSDLPLTDDCPQHGPKEN